MADYSVDEGTREKYDAKYAHKYDFNVTMTCTGCSGAINRALGKSFQPYNADDSPKKNLTDDEKQKPTGRYAIDLGKKRVEVWSDDVDYQWTHDKIAATKKKINSAVADGQMQPIAA